MNKTIINAAFTLKGFKHAKFASQETECFEATVCFNDIPVAHASNEGHGGCTNIHLTPAGRANAEVLAAFNKEEFDDASLNSIVDNLVHAKLQEKEDAKIVKRAQKDLATRILFTRPGDKPGRYRFIKQKFDTAEITKAQALRFKDANPDATVFNLLPFNEAYKLMVAQG